MLRVLLVLLLVPVASAIDVKAPTQVVDGDVAFWVTNLPADAENITVTMVGQSHVVPASAPFFVFEDIEIGHHVWVVEVANATEVVQTATGHVYVQDALSPLQILAELQTRLVSLQNALNDTQARVDDGNAANQGALQHNVSLLAADLQALHATVGEWNMTQPVQSVQQGAKPAYFFWSVGLSGLTMLLVAGLAVMHVRAQVRNKEQMVLVLAMAARMQINPDSPEFNTALAAID